MTQTETPSAATSETGADAPWHLRGNFAPVDREIDASDLHVIGQVPDELRGTYVRQSFNPRTGASPHWFFGHGMLHAVELTDGGARYRNRYVETPFAEHDGSGIEWLVDPTASPANTHVLRHNGKWLALEEQHKPFALDDGLTTLGVEDFGGAVTGSFTAHPKICPETGELLAFGYHVMGPPYLTYYRIGPSGDVRSVEAIDIPQPVMMHDWAVTRNHVVFLDLPVVFDLAAAMAGDDGGFLGWSPDNGARLGLMPRNGSNAEVTWHEIDPCFVFHTLGAHEEGDLVHVVACRQPNAMVGGFEDLEGTGATLWRWTIDRSTGRVTETQLDDRPADFPRTDDRRTGLPSRYGYLTQLKPEPGLGAPLGSDLYKYDLFTGGVEVHAAGPHTRLGEAVFGPRCEDAGEDDGWVLLYSHDEAEGVSELRIIDAQDFTADPVARVVLPQRVPYGAHGSWLAADAD